MTTFATMFSGGEGVGVGLRAAGLQHVWGVEFDADIAAVAADNGFPLIVDDVRQVDYSALPRVDWLHASPVCTRASVANSSAVESAEDIETAAAVVRAIKAQEPRIFTLENVWGYRDFAAFRLILNALGEGGYFYDFEHVNSADFGGEIKCPLHDFEHMTGSVLSAANSLSLDSLPRTAAPDIALAIAMMQPDDRAWHLAWDAVGHLVRATQQDIAANATFRKLVNELAASAALTTTSGRAAFISMNADMFVSASTASIGVNIAWLLNLCLDAPLLREKWSIISTETRKTTIRLILSSFLTTVVTSQSITGKHTHATPNGASGTSGERDKCPLCHVSAVPQTRRRLVLRASRGLLPMLPEPVPWVGWYSAIEDLLPTLPESKLAPWQLARLPEELRASVLFSSNGNNESFGDHHAEQNDPALSVTAQGLGRARAVLVDMHNAVREATVRGIDEPCSTQGASMGSRPSHQLAVLINESSTMEVRTAAEPAAVQVSSERTSRQKALLVAGLLNSECTTLTTRGGVEPSFTVTTSHNQRDARACPGARVVSMTARCLARFQSVPDAYRLPEKRTLAARVIGNMVPPLLMQRIAEGFEG